MMKATGSIQLTAKANRMCMNFRIIFEDRCSVTRACLQAVHLHSRRQTMVTISNGFSPTNWDGCTGVISCGIFPENKMIYRDSETNAMETGSVAFLLLTMHDSVISRNYRVV